MREPTGQTAIQLGRPGSIDHVVDDLQSKGLALLAGISGRADVLAFGRAIAAVRTHRDGSPDGVTTIAQRASAADTVGMGGFSARGLIPHTDGSALPESPRLLIMACLRPAVEGGDSVLIDGYQVYQAIAGTDPQMLDALCARDSVHFGTGAGYLGSIFQPLPGGRIAVRFRFDDLARFSPTVGRHVDGFRRLLARYARRGRLHAGDGYVLLNDRWLHGRTGFRGDRLMLRVLGDPLSQHAIPTGFPAGNPHVVAPGG
jgi:hypothetical protein